MTDLKNNLEEVWREEVKVWINHNLSKTQSILIHDLCERAYLEARKKSQKDLDLALNALQRESEENEILKQELAQSKKEADTLNTDWYKCASLNGQLNIQNRKLEQELQKTIEQLNKVEELLRKLTESAESLMTLGDRYTEHGQNIVDTWQYFQDKDKQGE